MAEITICRAFFAGVPGLILSFRASSQFFYWHISPQIDLAAIHGHRAITDSGNKGQIIQSPEDKSAANQRIILISCVVNIKLIQIFNQNHNIVFQWAQCWFVQNKVGICLDKIHPLWQVAEDINTGLVLYCDLFLEKHDTSVEHHIHAHYFHCWNCFVGPCLEIKQAVPTFSSNKQYVEVKWMPLQAHNLEIYLLIVKWIVKCIILQFFEHIKFSSQIKRYLIVFGNVNNGIGDQIYAIRYGQHEVRLLYYWSVDYRIHVNSVCPQCRVFKSIRDNIHAIGLWIVLNRKNYLI